MPMAINTVEEFEKVLNISWYTHDQPIENLRFVIWYNPQRCEANIL